MAGNLINSKVISFQLIPDFQPFVERKTARKYSWTWHTAAGADEVQTNDVWVVNETKTILISGSDLKPASGARFRADHGAVQSIQTMRMRSNFQGDPSNRPCCTVKKVSPFKVGTVVQNFGLSSSFKCELLVSLLVVKRCVRSFKKYWKNSASCSIWLKTKIYLFIYSRQSI